MNKPTFSILSQIPHFCLWGCGNLYVCLKRHPFLVLAILLLTFLIVFLMKWGVMCTDMQPWWHIHDICSKYSTGLSIGNLCSSLCDGGDISSLSCHSLYLGKEAVFSGKWRNSPVVFKSPKASSNGADVSHWPKEHYPSEEEFIDMIKENMKLKFNVTLSHSDAKTISHLNYEPDTMLSRQIEMTNVWYLLQDNEYVALLLYDTFEIFPRLIGSCGPLYAVIKLNSISGFSHLWTLYDSKEEWRKRVKLSMLILDYLFVIENKVPEPLYLCDVKMSHFGVTDGLDKIKYLDVDSVHPYSIVNKITGDGSKCTQHSDCDYFDCRSYCNLVTQKCLYGVSNNNLQMVCERIFLGWMMSGKLLVPGLLLGPRAPQSLINLLENCANPTQETGAPRSPASNDMRKSLYNLLKQLI